jgi:hypothetical protein
LPREGQCCAKFLPVGRVGRKLEFVKSQLKINLLEEIILKN